MAMMKESRKKSHNLFRALISLMLFIALLSPIAGTSVKAKPVTKENETENTVRVGWFESQFNYRDSNGRRTGYGYEYQQKIAAYTGWTYEYVEGTWTDLYHMLEEGEIDILTEVSYLPERTKNILYTEDPMGREEYYVFVSVDNEEISEDRSEERRVGKEC